MFVSPFVDIMKPSPFVDVFSPVVQKKAEPEPPQQVRGNTYVNFLADRSGCGMWRIGWPEYLINMANLGDSTSLNRMIFDKNWFRDIKAIKLQRQASTHQKEYIKFLKSIQSEMGFKLLYEVDDVVFREEIPDYNVFKPGFDTDEIRQNCVDMINMVDEVTVTCEYMKNLYTEKTGKKEITVVPNFPPYHWIGHQYNYNKIINEYDKNKKRPRIVYSGSAAHFDMGNKTGQQDDFTHVIKFITNNLEKYQFVFIGAVPIPLQQYVNSKHIEFHPWRSLIEYPNFLASLNAQLFIAPLMDNSFNKSKSDIKFVEANCLGIPCLCQDMETYKNAPPELKFTDSDDLAQKVENLLNWKNKSKYYRLVPELRKLGESRFLEHPENIGAFLEALNTPYGDPSRKFLKKWN